MYGKVKQCPMFFYIVYKNYFSILLNAQNLQSDSPWGEISEAGRKADIGRGEMEGKAREETT